MTRTLVGTGDSKAQVLELKLSRLRNELLKDETADLNDEVLVLLTGETEPPEMRTGVLPPLSLFLGGV